MFLHQKESSEICIKICHFLHTVNPKPKTDCINFKKDSSINYVMSCISLSLRESFMWMKTKEKYLLLKNERYLMDDPLMDICFI